MCSLCLRDANLCVSTLIYVLGRLDVSSVSDAVRTALSAFAAAPSDAGLQSICTAIRDDQLSPLVHDAVRDVEGFGGINAVLAAADQHHADNFHSAMRALGGKNGG